MSSGQAGCNRHGREGFYGTPTLMAAMPCTEWMIDTASVGDYQHLSSYRRCVERIVAAWPRFSAQRSERLQQGLFGAPLEKVAEYICEDLFTQVLDWSLVDVNLQVGRADIVLSELGNKRLVLEVKRPESLRWHGRVVEAALDQARGYAAARKAGEVAVSDGQMLFAADVADGGLRDQLFVTLDRSECRLQPERTPKGCAPRASAPSRGE